MKAAAKWLVNSLTRMTMPALTNRSAARDPIWCFSPVLVNDGTGRRVHLNDPIRFGEGFIVATAREIRQDINQVISDELFLCRHSERAVHELLHAQRTIYDRSHKNGRGLPGT